MRLKQKEIDIQRGILEWLKLCRNVVAWRSNSGRAMLPGKGGKLRPVTFGIPGQADITGIVDGGRRLEIEVKSERGQQSDDQREFQLMIERCGGIYILSRSIDDVLMGLLKSGIRI